MKSIASIACVLAFFAGMFRIELLGAAKGVASGAAAGWKNAKSNGKK